MSEPQTAKQPNLLFIMPDQLRADFLSCYGATFIDTPHIDSIAESGVRYERAYSASPICVPARASLLTGLNAIKNGVTDNGQWLNPDLAACGIETWPQTLSNQGYYTAARRYRQDALLSVGHQSRISVPSCRGRQTVAGDPR